MSREARLFCSLEIYFRVKYRKPVSSFVGTMQIILKKCIVPTELESIFKTLSTE